METRKALKTELEIAAQVTRIRELKDEFIGRVERKDEFGAYGVFSEYSNLLHQTIADVVQGTPVSMAAINIVIIENVARAIRQATLQINPDLEDEIKTLEKAIPVSFESVALDRNGNPVGPDGEKET